MKWLVATIAAIFLVVALPWAVTAAKASVRSKGRVAGVTLAIGLAFSAVFDPAKSAAVEEVEKKKELSDAGESTGTGQLD